MTIDECIKINAFMCHEGSYRWTDPVKRAIARESARHGCNYPSKWLIAEPPSPPHPP